jgi:hypothetical protein
MFNGELAAGFEGGRQFCQDIAHLEVEAERLEETAVHLQQVVDAWPFQLSGPFVTLVSGVVGAAAAAREANDYPPLSEDELIGYLAHSASILDSLKHV